ncbi:hypothetical protein ONZ45_g19670 [Pleurotus djamor]|nr:hypothetical protein ONZ45_g19670 [Pleurotus djamor]
MYIASLISYLAFAATVLSIPTWDNWSRQQTIGSLVPGASFIQALGPSQDKQLYKGHLSTATPGFPGNLTLIKDTLPPLFFINHNWLWQVNNETSIYRVNVVNSTGTAGMPMQLKLGKKAEGIKGGAWRWRGATLYYDQPGGDSQAAFYSCPMSDGSTGIFVYTVS